MSEKRKSASLLNPQATGGDIAESGFQYQANLIAARVPAWLYQDGFTSAIRESLGDVEASFFIPEKGISREFVEYKNHRLTPTEFWPEIEHFQEINEDSRGVYHKYVLACTDVSNDLKTLINALRRVREAYFFYQTAPSIRESSYVDFEAKVIKLGRSKDLANFIFIKVWFEIDLTDAENFPRELFRDALFKFFPEFQNLQGKISTLAYTNVVELLRSKKNKLMTRRELENAIWSAAGSDDYLNQRVSVHTSHDEHSTSPENAICFNWKEFFGGPERKFPSQDEWNNNLLQQLEETKKWFTRTNRSRRIYLTGYRRLTASTAIGSVFSSVSGFSIEMETKDGPWKTDNYPASDTPGYFWLQTLVHGSFSGEIAIAIGVMKNIRVDVEHYLDLLNFEGHRLYLLGEKALVSDKQAILAVESIKRIILEKKSSLSFTKIHMFIAGPAQLALFLGHRLNATCTIQCYEQQTDGYYVPTCLLSN